MTYQERWDAYYGPLMGEVKRRAAALYCGPSTTKCMGFDTETCKSMLGDERTREIEEIGRLAADAGDAVPDCMTTGETYWSAVSEKFEQVVLHAAYSKRVARVQRMAERQQAISNQRN